MSELSFRSVIALWPTPDAMAVEIGASVYAARKWSYRNRIPPEWWLPLLRTPRVVQANITAETLAELAARDVAETG